MAEYSPELNGLGSGSLFATANFQDSYELTPTAVLFDIGGNGSSTPYTPAMNGVLMKQLDEIKQKSMAALALPQGWKKRLRDFISNKNTKLLDFLQLSIPSHPTLGKGETILRKFGNINLHPNHPTIKDLVLDASGTDIIREIGDTLVSMRTTDGLKDYLSCVQYLYDQYREAGEEALKAEAQLKQKLEIFDRIQGRVISMLDLDPNEAYAPLLEATEGYLERLFEKHQIAEIYTSLISAYRRFIALREVVLMTRALHAQEQEPLCTICLNESVSFCLSPCGHTYCAGCTKKQTGTCYVCRSTIREKVRLYFG